MEHNGTIESSLRTGRIGAILTIVGTLLSGPLAFLTVSAIQPQPAWSGPTSYVENYHLIQSVTFYFGFLLLTGSVLMVASVYVLDARRMRSLLALVFTSVACGLIALNYFTQATFVPALIRSYEPTLDPVITVISVTNPASIFWAVEMWGYGFLGLGTWLAAGHFDRGGIEGATKALFVINGVVSVVGALYTSLRLEWVLSTAGLVAYAAWNGLYVVLAVLFLIVLNGRRA